MDAVMICARFPDYRIDRRGNVVRTSDNRPVAGVRDAAGRLCVSLVNSRTGEVETVLVATLVELSFAGAAMDGVGAVANAKREAWLTGGRDDRG